MWILFFLFFSSPAYATPNFLTAKEDVTLGSDIMMHIMSFLSARSLRTVASLNSELLTYAREVNVHRYTRKYQKLQSLMDNFIPLAHEGTAISVVAVSQQMWGEVMMFNSSYFNAQKYCPDTYYESKNNTYCPNFPVESISFERGATPFYSVQEFLAKINEIYKHENAPYRFRLPTDAEWTYAAAGGTSTRYVSGSDAFDLKDYVSYWLISGRDEKDLDKPSPSGEEQPHTLKAKLPNAYGFYRSGVWEFTSEIQGTNRIARGCSFESEVVACATAFKKPVNTFSRSYKTGFRLVRITK